MASRIIEERPAGPNHAVVSVESEVVSYRRTPCRDCPWRVDAVGEFPAEAFRHSAETAYDMSQREFACHSSGSEKVATCAGYLLRGATHNLSTRLRLMNGRVDLSRVSDGGVELFDSYREMAVANGVDPDDPVLDRCR